MATYDQIAAAVAAVFAAEEHERATYARMVRWQKRNARALKRRDDRIAELGQLLEAAGLVSEDDQNDIGPILIVGDHAVFIDPSVGAVIRPVGKVPALDHA